MVQRDTDQTPVITLREITGDTVVTICNLSDTLTYVQKQMVASNAISIAQAYFDRHLWFRAIYVEDEPAGFLMLYDDPEGPEYFLWRLMIAGLYQRSGVGGRAIQLLVEHVNKQRPGARELLVSCGEGEGSPEVFYLKQGFQRNGKMYGDEIGLVMPLD